MSGADASTTDARKRRSPTLRPRDAATLILVDRSGARPLVLMGRRHASHKFMPGKYVFPGGRIEPGDRRMSVAGPLDGLIEDKLMARTRRPSPGFARALALAAIRETFEETGLALGVTDHGTAPDAPDGVWRRFADTGVIPALEALDFVARAITPPGRPKRFDTRFFIADAKWIAHRTEDVVSADSELVELIWIPLDEATSLDLPNITKVILAELAEASRNGMSRFRARPFYRTINKRSVREEL